MNLGFFGADLPLVLAPMAGVTDLPFRYLCCKLGADWAVSEMVSSNPKVWNSNKSRQRMAGGIEQTELPEELKDAEPLRIVQIAGSDPTLLAEAAKYNVAQGADVIDINMGCPVKKVNKKLAGSALLREPQLIKQILTEVVNAVSVPVTLKIRTGWSPQERNGVEIAQLAEQCGIQALSVHGRTRSCMFKGQAEFDTVKAIKSAISIPVLANGDITTAKQAKEILEYTGVDGLMIGRGAQGNPWIFREVSHYLSTGKQRAKPTKDEFKNILMQHLHLLHHFYGEMQGVRIARKHVGWYLRGVSLKEFRASFNRLDTAQSQTQALTDLFNTTK